MKKTYLLGLVFWSIAASSWAQQAAQDSSYKIPANSRAITADLLSSYYQQDGQNGAVQGGQGTEKLQDVANKVQLYVPLDKNKAIQLQAGADSYSSASTDEIDNNPSSASAQDLRAYGQLSYQHKLLRQGLEFSVGGGFSTEYDYQSVSANLGIKKDFYAGNSQLAFNFGLFQDNWKLIYPRELRGFVDAGRSDRQSLSFSLAYSQMITPSLQAIANVEYIRMAGLLSTPFHRVFFDDLSLDIERLPEIRSKIPASIRLHYYLNDYFILRSFYRYYWDDFGVEGHTAELELPIQLHPNFNLQAFYRYHQQTASDYFAPFAEHSVNSSFYTSDYDLSAFHSQQFGLGFRYAPAFGLLRSKSFLKSKRVVLFKSISARLAYYQRSTGLEAFIASLHLAFSLE
ncbi:DUF3570 domain-containing protein [Saprospira grandis]|uniref:DUF3570 domain-containing protein n=1 Tax=Saprospira grandis TaxID=1008 RepID=UPI0022DE0288|nr:DUF3570 domain-containing protein [Saprospira grandis]WBM73064.1 DUF3570 domain-containing protein [Saprospira grandis]